LLTVSSGQPFWGWLTVTVISPVAALASWGLLGSAGLVRTGK